VQSAESARARAVFLETLSAKVQEVAALMTSTSIQTLHVFLRSRSRMPSAVAIAKLAAFRRDPMSTCTSREAKALGHHQSAGCSGPWRQFPWGVSIRCTSMVPHWESTVACRLLITCGGSTTFPNSWGLPGMSSERLACELCALHCNVEVRGFVLTQR
jgi:hypothetical protein